MSLLLLLTAPQAVDLTAAGIASGVPSVGAPELAERAEETQTSGGRRGFGRRIVPIPQVPLAPVVVALSVEGVFAGAPTIGRPALTQQFDPVLMDNDLLLMAA